MKDTTMYSKAKPICGPGSRNVHCPHYGACLDYAVKHVSEYWNCRNCPHKLKQESMTETECALDGSVLHYRLPSNMYGELRNRFG